MHILLFQEKYDIILIYRNGRSEATMTIKRVTMAELAQACGLSRNTVSKVFNDRGAVPETTRQAVIQKAREMGYHMSVSTPVPAKNQNIALLTQHMPSGYHFGSFFISSFADQLSRVGYTLTMSEVTSRELADRVLPDHINPEQTAGIVAIEVFDKGYHDMLCDLGIPLVFIDDCYGSTTAPLRCDTISMENISSSYALCSHIIAAGAKHIGFVGDITHCNSFYERWIGYVAAMEHADLPINRSMCILAPDGPEYADTDWLFSVLRKMPTTPDALVCANDFLALNVLSTLKQHGLSVPGDILLAGFDGTPQSAIVEPSLTTASIPSANIGRLAAETLLSRIENPDRSFQRMYVATTPEFRNSTKK